MFEDDVFILKSGENLMILNKRKKILKQTLNQLSKLCQKFKFKLQIGLIKKMNGLNESNKFNKKIYDNVNYIKLSYKLVFINFVFL